MTKEDMMSTKSNRPRPGKSSKAKKGIKPEVWVAIIGGTATVAVALFSFPPFIALFQKDPTPTVTLTVTETPKPATATDTPQPSATGSSTLTPTVTEALPPTATQTQTPTATNTAAPTITKGLPVGMDVQLVTDKTSGKHPLSVAFDARGSFFRDAKGDIYPCGVCTYTWYVYQNSNLINDPQRSSKGTFSYKFGRSGNYRVVVRVCRGTGDSDCGYDGEDISVQ